MKSLREIYTEHNDRLMHKWDHYIDIYNKYFTKYSFYFTHLYIIENI